MSKKEEIRAKRRRQQRIQTAFTIGGVVLVALLFLLFLIGPSLREVLYPEAVPEVVEWETHERPNPNRNSMGDPNAPIKMEEFSDFQCSFCGRFMTETEPLIAEAYVKTGKVYFIYRSMGNWSSANVARATGQPEKSESRDSSMAAYCAADQDKFWYTLDGLFANYIGTDAGSYTRPRLSLIAEKAGLDVEQFDACMASDKYLEQVNKDFDEGSAAGITGTPSFVLTYTVAGESRQKLIVGAVPFSQFQQEIDAILAEIE